MFSQWTKPAGTDQKRQKGNKQLLQGWRIQKKEWIQIPLLEIICNFFLICRKKQYFCLGGVKG